MTTQKIRIADDFTQFPFGRYRNEGEHSGEVFREEYLWPILSRGDNVEINLDGVLGGLGSSFLEEVFGGMIRDHNYTPERLRERVLIVSDEDPSLVTRTWEYVKRAAGKAA